MRAGGVLALLALLTIPAAAYAEDSGPPDPPQGRLGPPIGVAAESDQSVLDDFWTWLMARLGPPIG